MKKLYLKSFGCQMNERDSQVVTGHLPFFLHFFLIAALGFGAYFNSLFGEFLMDDPYLVEQNVYLRDGGHWKEILTQSHMAGSGDGEEANFYRPIQVASYVLDYFIC